MAAAALTLRAIRTPGRLCYPEALPCYGACLRPPHACRCLHMSLSPACNRTLSTCSPLLRVLARRCCQPLISVVIRIPRVAADTQVARGKPRQRHQRTVPHHTTGYTCSCSPHAGPDGGAHRQLGFLA